MWCAIPLLYYGRNPYPVTLHDHCGKACCCMAVANQPYCKGVRFQQRVEGYSVVWCFQTRLGLMQHCSVVQQALRNTQLLTKLFSDCSTLKILTFSHDVSVIRLCMCLLHAAFFCACLLGKLPSATPARCTPCTHLRRNVRTSTMKYAPPPRCTHAHNDVRTPGACAQRDPVPGSFQIEYHFCRDASML